MLLLQKLTVLESKKNCSKKNEEERTLQKLIALGRKYNRKKGGTRKKAASDVSRDSKKKIYQKECSRGSRILRKDEETGRPKVM